MTTYDGINQHNLNLDADRFTTENFGLVFNRLVSISSLGADMDTASRSQRSCGLRRESTAARLLGL